MHTRDPEKFHWYRLQKDVLAEEEGELEEEEDEQVQEQEPPIGKKVMTGVRGLRSYTKMCCPMLHLLRRITQ